MARRKPPDPKAQALRDHGCLNPHPERVADPAFVGDDFFDARNVVQVKYEMLRRVRVDGNPVATSAAAFGLSRPTFYHAQTAFERDGLGGLVPSKPGPRHAHKLSEDVVDLLEQKVASGEVSGASELAALVKDHFGRDVHPRSVERALARREKKRQREATSSSRRRR